MFDIVTFGHPSLKIKSKNVDNFDDELKDLTDNILEIMYEAPGVGLAAPQIGINKNIFVFDIGDGPNIAVNPISIKVSGKVNFFEGCLSLPGYYWEIERPEYAKLDCFDLKGNKIFYEGDDLLGRVLQHEFDHLKAKRAYKKQKYPKLYASSGFTQGGSGSSAGRSAGGNVGLSRQMGSGGYKALGGS